MIFKLFSKKVNSSSQLL